MVEAEPDDAVTAEVSAELDSLEKELDRRELELLYSDPYSDNPAIVGIHAGAGGTDSQDWAEMLMRMYLRWAEEKKYTVEFIDESPGDRRASSRRRCGSPGRAPSGCSSRSAACTGWCASAPFDSAARRHTSFALVEVTPEIEDAVDIDIDPKDVREDVYRSSGAGGQHVNKTSSAIRLTHVPTGVVVTCQNERSQHQNREVAWRVLRSRLLALKQAAHAEHVAELRGESMPAEWGSQIRSYVLHPYTMVKDHRTGAEVGNAQAVLDGNLDPFMEAYLRWSAREAAA